MNGQGAALTETLPALSTLKRLLLAVDVSDEGEDEGY